MTKEMKVKIIKSTDKLEEIACYDSGEDEEEDQKQAE